LLMTKLSVSVAMAPELVGRVDSAAHAERMNRSEFVCRALESALGAMVQDSATESVERGSIPQGGHSASSRAPKDLVGAGSCSGCGRFNGVHAKDCPLHPSNL
jgi:predicted transcriptional regulator